MKIYSHFSALNLKITKVFQGEIGADQASFYVDVSRQNGDLVALHPNTLIHASNNIFLNLPVSFQSNC